MDETWRYKAHDLIRKQATALVEGMGANLDLHIDVGYPTVDNDPVFTDQVWQQAEHWMGKEHVEETEMRMGAEDFGYYSQQIPGCFFRIGVRNQEKGIIHQVHTPRFNVDERVIEEGIGVLAWLGAVVIPNPSPASGG